MTDTKSEHKYEETKAQFAKEKNIKNQVSKMRYLEQRSKNTSLTHAMRYQCSTIQYNSAKRHAFIAECIMFQVQKTRIKTESLCYPTAF